ncbi:MAG: ATP-dependent zinc metalloprotease FtsH [Clostridia bacterium]|jgi:cell division protease FtsH|nr:ATP-dependent zinc metalloprotease FtsH [Clostridiaceae bacterium]
MNESKSPKKPLIYYYIISLVVLMLLNWSIIPALFKMPEAEVDYGTFLDELYAGNISDVSVTDEEISFLLKEYEGKQILYKTGNMNEPDLTNKLYEAGVNFYKVLPKRQSYLVSLLLTWVLPFLIVFLIGQAVFRTLQNKMGGYMSLGKSNAKIYVEAQTGKTFADVAGQEEAKEALKEIVDFLHNPDKYRQLGAKIPKGVLLVGPPGTGKTLLAKAVAGESNVPFFSISGSEFVEMFVGMGAARVRDLFKQAQEKAPCIVFIDEIDTIGKSRNAGGLGGNDEREQTLNQLLTEMDGFSSDKGVIILAATNRPEILDKALLRPGRFDRRVPLELPDLQGREAILKLHAQKVKVDGNVDFNLIARATSGASGADLANIINEAALRAVRLGKPAVDQSDLEESVETVIAGYQRKNAVISKKDKLIIAYHEVGHALVAAVQDHTAPIHKITIVPRTSGALGYTLQVDEGEQILMSKEQALSRITTYMGGRAAEQSVFNSITTGASNDIAQATKLARAMVTRFGMSEEFGMMALETVNNPYLGEETTLLVSSETASKVDQTVLNILRECYQRALDIMEEYKGKLHELAKELLDKETLSGDEFMRIFNEPGNKLLPDASS